MKKPSKIKLLLIIPACDIGIPIVFAISCSFNLGVFSFTSSCCCLQPSHYPACFYYVNRINNKTIKLNQSNWCTQMCELNNCYTYQWRVLYFPSSSVIRKEEPSKATPPNFGACRSHHNNDLLHRDTFTMCKAFAWS